MTVARHLHGLAVLGVLAFVLHTLWPTDAITALLEGDAPVGGPSQAPEVIERPADAQPLGKPLRVLFVGNSHTHYHSMPTMIGSLARAAGEVRPLEAVVLAPGGAKLKQHLLGGRVSERLSVGRWDHVVLQEQQQMPSYTYNRKWMERFYAPARTLDVMARAVGATTILYMTWARANGNSPQLEGDSYEAMQERVRKGYATLAQEIDVDVAPVGVAWARAYRQRPGLQLWHGDGSHASRAGSYLAACVFYAVLYGQSPVANRYTADLPHDDASFLQTQAAAVVPLPR